MLDNPVIPDKIKAEWVAELRSGKYRQAVNYLNVVDSNEYCCLGVLCRLAEQDNVVDSQLQSGYVFFESLETPGDRSHQILPDAVVAWANIKDQYGDITIYAEEFDHFDLKENFDWSDVTYLGDGQVAKVQLTALNDGGVSFEQIADLIEKYL